MFIMLPCSQRALILVLEHVGNFGMIAAMASVYFVRSNVEPLCCEVTSASKMYAASRLADV